MDVERCKEIVKEVLETACSAAKLYALEILEKRWTQEEEEGTKKYQAYKAYQVEQNLHLAERIEKLEIKLNSIEGRLSDESGHKEMA